MDDIFVGRQPIFNRRREVFAYELLFRSGETGSAHIRPGEGDRATSEVFAHAVLDIGTAQLVRGLPAFVNLGRGFLADNHPLPLSPDELVIEVLEDVPPEPAVVERLLRLSGHGYRIALDDFRFRAELLPIFEVADIIKLDIQALNPGVLERHVRFARRAGKRLLAEKVETCREYEYCFGLGFDYFQGYFLCRPDLVRGQCARNLPAFGPLPLRCPPSYGEPLQPLEDHWRADHLSD
jgi:EAL and modified HD-GYP domain-containing signal transduction protein